MEPYTTTLPAALIGTGAVLVDLDAALRDCGTLILLVDHVAFRAVPLSELGDKAIYDTRGLWGDKVLVERVFGRQEQRRAV